MDHQIYLLGLNHRTAGVEIREKFALTDCNPIEDKLFPIQGPVLEVVVLSTCNRVEILAVADARADHVPDLLLGQWAEARGADAASLKPYVYMHEGLDAVRHLFTVASSLDSMVLGEPQILGQLKDAYRMAIKHGSTGTILNRAMHKAFSVAKRVRTETAVASSAVSISYAAVALAKRIFGELSGHKAMLIGAGEMAELAAQHLVTGGIDTIFVANRTYERGQTLAAQFCGEAILFEQLYHRLVDVDIIISSTGAHEAVIRSKDIKAVLKKRKHRPMFFIDIAVPRDIDPDVNNLDNVYLYDIDDLKEVVEENMAQRREEAAKAHAIVETETSSFGKWLMALDLQPTIVDLLHQGEDLGARELAKTLKRLGPVSEEQQEALETLVASITSKLLHEPIAFLRRRADEEAAMRHYIDVTRRMFNLDQDAPDEDEEAKPHPERRTRNNSCREKE